MRAGRALLLLTLTLAAVAGGCSQESPDPMDPTTVPPTSRPPSATPTPSPSPTTLAQARTLADRSVARVTVTSWMTGVEFEEGYFDGCAVGTGTAFAVYPNLLVTAAHVVEGRDRLRVTFGGTTTPGTVVGYDRRKDVALIRIERETPGLLSFSDRTPEIGEEVATLGYAEGGGLSYLEGDVNRVNHKEDVAGNFMTGLVEVDFAAQGGNSGGPVFDSTGLVVGIHVAGQSGAGGRLAVSSSTADELVREWRAQPSSDDLPTTTCPLLADEWVPEGTEVVDEHSAAVHSAALTVQNYVHGINSGDFRTAHAQLAADFDYEEFVDGVETSGIEDLVYVVAASEPSPVLDVDFTTTQASGDGPTGRPDERCTMWHLRYTFAARDDMWLIDTSTATPGEQLNEACPDSWE